MFKLTKNLSIQGVLDFQDSGFDKYGGEIEGEGLRPPSELCIFPLLNFLTGIKIKYNENTVRLIVFRIKIT